MRLSLHAVIRLVCMLALALFASAVFVSRSVPEPSAFRAPASTRYFSVNGAMFDPPVLETFLLDAETGALNRYDPVPGYRVEYAGTAPWTDENGGYEIVARLTSRFNEPAREGADPSALVRIPLAGGPVKAEPSGRPVIIGRPCWLPGHRDRVLFPGGDGKLYAQDLTGGDADAAEIDRGPRALRWEDKVLGGAAAIVSDPFSTDIPDLKGKVLVSISRETRATGRQRLANPQLWWLEIDKSGTTIVNGGPLFRDGSGSPDETQNQRCPSLTALPDGRVTLAYLSRVASRSDWELMLAPVRFDGKDGGPVVDESDVRVVGAGYAPVTPAFSSNGAILRAITKKAGDDGDRVQTLSVADALRMPAGKMGRLALGQQRGR